MSVSTRVKFDNPPVVEVVCGILFGTPTPVKAPLFGLYWDRIRNDFPVMQEAIPLSPVIEIDGAPGFVDIDFDAFPPMRRVLLISSDGRTLVQVQHDRFLFNWKKAAADDTYPSYDNLIPVFHERLTEFLKFLEDMDVGLPVYRQFELSYINQIPMGLTTDQFDVNENRILVDHARDESRERFLPQPEGVNWTSIYPLPNQEGRLYAAARSGRSPDGAKVLRLDMTARGIPVEPTPEKLRGWFEQAHTWITHGFADITSAAIQQRVWRRKE